MRYLQLKIVIRALMLSLLPVTLMGCSFFNYMTGHKTEEQKRLETEQRIESHRQKCEMIGYKRDTEQNALCVMELEKAFLSKSTSYQGNDARTRQLIHQERMRQQTIQHGSGGCTPNYATGGCL